MNQLEGIVLQGRFVRLEPLGIHHAAALAEASAINPSLYRWSRVPVGRLAVERYIEAAMEMSNARTAMPFATIRTADDAVIGSTRFFDLERWEWPQSHPRYGRMNPDVGEIGSTWLSATAIRSAANTEAKLLMLAQAFEVWGMLRVCFHTDARNDRSSAALARIGAQFEGVLRAHRMASDFIARDSKRYSIVAAEWPEVKKNLQVRLTRPG
jgi:N-acetyltransferase